MQQHLSCQSFQHFNYSCSRKEEAAGNLQSVLKCLARKSVRCHLQPRDQADFNGPGLEANVVSRLMSSLDNLSPLILSCVELQCIKTAFTGNMQAQHCVEHRLMKLCVCICILWNLQVLLRGLSFYDICIALQQPTKYNLTLYTTTKNVYRTLRND